MEGASPFRVCRGLNPGVLVSAGGKRQTNLAEKTEKTPVKQAEDASRRVTDPISAAESPRGRKTASPLGLAELMLRTALRRSAGALGT